ncbi:hypothetical protein ACEPAG_917 [Sanghuangporus baumii]
MSSALGASDCASPSATGGRLNAVFPTHSLGPSSANDPLITQAPALFPRQSDGSCSVAPNEVLLRISTTVLIPDYSSFYTATPISQFRMDYTPFPDGSLIAPPYISEIRRGDWTLLFSGMMLMLFIATSVVAADYIRRVKVKHKVLFYELLISQLCGVVAFAITAATILASNINCRIALVVGGVFTELSAAILLSGILGVKAYRCLSDSKIVLSVIIVLQAASSTMSFLDLAKLEASRRLSLTCNSSTNSILFPLSTTLRFVLALFICSCFVYAVWKSEKLPAAQGRISISLSGQGPQQQPTGEKGGDLALNRPRGWWDYVPERNAKPMEEPRVQTWHIVDDQGFVGNMRYLFGALIKNESSGQTALRKGSDATLVASPHAQSLSKPPTIQFRENSEHSRFSVVSRAQSATPSKTRSLGPLMNRMKLFREALRNELAYTALITIFNVIATILGLVGVFARSSAIDPNVFTGSYWGILSLLVMQSFRRVVQRHEREALLQHPSTWDPLYHVEKVTNGEVRQGISTASVSSNPWRARSMIINPLSGPSEGVDPLDRQEESSKDARTRNVAENPFEDFEFAGPSDKGKNIAVPTHTRGLASEQLPPTETISLFSDSASSQWTDSQDRDSISRYSDRSSQSLFYLEKTNSR